MRQAIFRLLVKHSSNRFFAFALTLRARLLIKKKITFSWVADRDRGGLFEVIDYSQDFWPNSRRFAERVQGFVSYRDGFEQRAREMCEAYSLHSIEFEDNDTIVDCGANYGDLELALKYLRVPSINYFAFEPDPSAFKSLQFNSESPFLFNEGLWEEDGESTFYMASHADSSFIKPPNSTMEIKVMHRKLDSVLDGPSQVKLLKIEAEGAEPEVLRGSSSTLKITENVAVDVGRERGMAQESTLVEATNLLTRSGFLMNRLSSKRLAVLFSKNKRA